jgi:hypothetical protein
MGAGRKIPEGAGCKIVLDQAGTTDFRWGWPGSLGMPKDVGCFKDSSRRLSD